MKLITNNYKIDLVVLHYTFDHKAFGNYPLQTRTIMKLTKMSS
jgi:hypothetical protein